MSKSIVPKDFYVYIHRKATTGEIFYVGKGYGGRAFELRRSVYWHRVANKHRHLVEFVQTNLQEWYAKELEMELIALYGRRDLGLGPLVNMTDDGDGMSGHAHSEETKKKMSVRIKQTKANPSVFKKQSDANVLSWANPEIRQKRLYGMRLAFSSLETRAKLSISAKNSWSNPEIKQKRIGVLKDALARDEVKEKIRLTLSDPLIKERHRIARGAKPILCVETGQIFATSCCAQKWLRVKNPKANGSNVISVCKGLKRSAYGYTWRYA